MAKREGERREIRCRASRPVLCVLRNVTVSHSRGKWFASIQTEREIDQPIPDGSSVGIDMGIVALRDTVQLAGSVGIRLSGKIIQQGFGLLPVGEVEALGKAAMDISQRSARCVQFSLQDP